MTQKSGDRRRAREHALQLLFQLDLCPSDTQRAIEAFWGDINVPDAVRGFADEIVRGTMSCRDALDGVIASAATNWRIARMAVVDRNVLRMALYEFFFQPDTPRVVVIDEAIEIAKTFGNDESGPFVNGVLDAIRLKLEAGELSLPESLRRPLERRSTA
ncbi:MAG TPA: transcription antitermination factor NusB [Candidatus Polarisedimenticolia bacterium]|nr:transcription antitermination factor NusB [Candidatus Polarisedimenticolia bacterium]